MRRSDRVFSSRRRARRHPGIRIAFVAALVLVVGGAAIALADTDDHHQPAKARHASSRTVRRGTTTSQPRRGRAPLNVYAHTGVGMFT
ncbi:MAG: hypothetical protein ACJ8DJ_15590, partial [Gemmatimonadales bacterium]